MHKLTHTTLIAIGSVTGAMMFAGGIVTGCGSSSASGDDTEEDSGADSTAPKPDSGADAGRDSSLATFDSGTVTEDTGTGDTGAVTADTGLGDTGTGTGDASDSGEVTGEGGSEAGDGGAEAEAGCTTILDLTDAGTAVLVTGFDNGVITGWGSTTENSEADASVTGTVAYSPTVGRTCPGSIAMTVPFTQYAYQQVALGYNYQNDVQNYPVWTKFTKLHYWVMVAFDGTDGGALDKEAGAPFFPSLNDNNNFTQWNAYSSASNDNGASVGYFPGPSFSNAEWQEVTLLLSDPKFDAGNGEVPTGAGCRTGNACKIESQLQIESASGMTGVVPAGGPPAPTTTLLYIDDIWLE
jgi:hypothetical protein